MKELKVTGERLVTNSYFGHIGMYEHLHRYALALELASGKVVLDIASGEGYGSNLLAGVASKVIGVDVSEEAIIHANEKYKKDNLEYLLGSTSAIPLPDSSIDLYVSFETIEHHDEHLQMMMEAKRVLKPNGILILSSPEKTIYQKRDPSNPFHIKEITLEELETLISTNFKYHESFAQRVFFGTMINPIHKKISSFAEYDGGFYEINKMMKKVELFNEPFFNLIVASDQELDLSNFPGHSVFNAYDVYFKEMNTIKQMYEQSSAYKIAMILRRIYSPVRNLFRLS